jgi:hypothetical protein
MVVSDGIVEQFGIPESCPGEQQQFGVDGLYRSLTGSRTAKADPVAKLFADVFSHAGGPNLADDATAVLVTW